MRVDANDVGAFGNDPHEREMSMKKMFAGVSAVGAALLLSACALPETKNPGYEAKNDREVVTGSNVPRKDRGPVNVTYGTRDAVEKIQSQSGNQKGE
jgi:hypothetical protein